MVALSHAGSYLAGAFVGDAMVGAALGFWGSPAYGALHSHITGVLPSHAGQGVGSLIKNHQRDWVLAQGGSAITWTYDPLVVPQRALQPEPARRATREVSPSTCTASWPTT